MNKRLAEMCKDEKRFGIVKYIVHPKEINEMRATLLEISAINPYLAVSLYIEAEGDEDFEKNLHEELVKNFNNILETEQKTSADNLISFFLAFHSMKDVEYAKTICDIIFDHNNTSCLIYLSNYWFSELYETILNEIGTYYFFLRDLITANEHRQKPFRNGSERDILVRGMRTFIDHPPDGDQYPFRLIRMVNDCGLYKEFAQYVDYDLEALLKVIRRINNKAIQFNANLLSERIEETNDFKVIRDWNILYKFLLAYLLNEKGRAALCRYKGSDSPILTTMLCQLYAVGKDVATQVVHLPNKKADQQMQAAWNGKRNGFDKPFLLCFCFSPKIPEKDGKHTRILSPWWQCQNGHEWTMPISRAWSREFCCTRCVSQNVMSNTHNSIYSSNDTLMYMNSPISLRRASIVEHERNIIKAHIDNALNKNHTALSVLLDRIYTYSVYQEFWELVNYDIAWLNNIFAVITGSQEHHMEFIVGDDISWIVNTIEDNRKKLGNTQFPLTARQWNKLYRFLWFFLQRGTSIEELLTQYGEQLNPALEKVLQKIAFLRLTSKSQFHLQNEIYDKQFYALWDPVANEAVKPFVLLMANCETPQTDAFSNEEIHAAESPRVFWRCERGHEWVASLSKMFQSEFTCPLCTKFMTLRRKSK